MLLKRERRVKLKHDMYLIRVSVEAYALFLPIRRRVTKKIKLYKEAVKAEKGVWE